MNSTTLAKLLKITFALQVIINLIGALGPELGFDALWYHLTESQLFWQRRSLAPIPGNLLYWSGLPRLAEIFYFSAPIGKLIHFSFGVLSARVVYLLSRSMVAVNLFYSTLLVGWLSTTSYVDLIPTAFILLALATGKKLSQILYLTLAGATKITALIYNPLITLVPWTLLGALPFWLINWQSTGNFFYPFGEGFGFEGDYFGPSFWFWISRPLRLFLDPAFRVGPMLLLLFLLAPKKGKYFSLSLLALGLWLIGPGTDFGRFALIPIALVSVQAASVFSRQKTSLLPLGLLILHLVIGLGGRAYANAKYLPVITGSQSKAEFLTNNLKFHFGDFYDIDGWFAQNLKPTDKVLVKNIHNLYYINFPYDHETWAEDESNYTHVLVGDNLSLDPPPGPLIYQNPTTQVKLYLNEAY